ncbi:MAG TPA: hydroxyacylglutathione hydrolase C-terminal domain-containing protein, partial [Gammaproteobacteria bacterium]|nr:hydroxyacylglutathione hydrolase C-terminal domain-containing protein [Gammaproteobacteria bacterium]
IPGHTAGHIAFYGHQALFCGDTLFSGGCGRLFEGTPEQMLDSLTYLSGLPADTRVFCGHEYTVANLDFGLAVEPDNAIMAERRTWAQQETAADRPSLPSTLALEKQINIFLRSDQQPVQKAAAHWSDTRVDDNVAAFTKLRLWKDHFRG